MVLIGAAFFHRRYLKLYQDLPQSVHVLVDETQNCDDIAMNFAVAAHLKKTGSVNKPSGIFVKPVDLRNLEKEASSGYQGMWHRPEHLLQRSYCLNRLTQIFGFMPLHFSNLMVSQFGFPTYANHMSRGWGLNSRLPSQPSIHNTLHGSVIVTSYLLLFTWSGAVSPQGSWTSIVHGDCLRIFFFFFTQGPAWIKSRVDGILYIVTKTASPQVSQIRL